MSRKLSLSRLTCLVVPLSFAALAAGSAPASEPRDDPAAAQDTIIVIGSLVPLPIEDVGSAATLIGEEEIAARLQPFALDLLRGVPSVSVSRAGPAGALTQLRLRGAEANQTLVLIDGVEMSDPVSGEFDFGDLLTDDIARIEIIRGEQSSLWGSDAIGGVINIVTLDGEGPLRIGAGAGAGSFDTVHFRGSAGAGTERWSARLSGSTFVSDGSNVSRSGNEADGYRSSFLNFRGSLTPAPGLSFDLAARYANSRHEEDSGFPQPVDTDTLGTREQISARAAASLSLLEGRWRQRLAASVNDVAARSLEEGALTAESHGRRFRLDWQSDIFFRPRFIPGTEHRLTLYAEREHTAFENASVLSSVPLHEAETVNWGLAAEYALAVGEFAFLTGSLRHDMNEHFEDALTFRATASLKPGPSTRLHAGAGTGVRNPGFFDLFGFDPGFFLGNENLKPEQSVGWDAGVEQAFFGGRLLVDVTYYRSRLDDEIILVFLPPAPGRPEFPAGALTPVNADLDGRRQGVEVSLKAQLTEHWNLSATYSWADATENGAEEVRRPRHKAGLSTGLALLDGRAHVNLSADYVGTFRDFDFAVIPAARVEMDAYLLAGLAARYRLDERVEVWLRGDNLLDAEYEDVLYFRAPGISVTAGLTFAAEIGR